MSNELENRIKSLTGASKVRILEIIQELWSGYGQIVRVELEGVEYHRAIVKNIVPPVESNHPRGWNTNISHQRKLRSYQVEMEWYRWFASRCDENSRVPQLYHIHSSGTDQLIILEDLDVAGYPARKSWLSITEVKSCLSWLACFHAEFMGESTGKLWEEGCYWHLDTRPDEWKQMESGELKSAAKQLDNQLKRAKYKTLVHGDAKVANFCFSENGESVAAVDFQYIGQGCGMKDVGYLMGSCLSESECEEYEEELLEHYFTELRKALASNWDADKIEEEWRSLYSIAWADFTRFLLGWMPGHHKINGYSLKMVNKALKQLG